MLAITWHAVQDTTGTYPDNSKVWQATQHLDFSKTYRTFIWKYIYSMHKIGGYWAQIPNFEHRERCIKCGVTEDLEHILLHCDIPGQNIVWKNTKQLWSRKHKLWPELQNIGQIAGCGLIKFNNRDGKALKHVSRMNRILISESVHFIWKLRCQRVSKDKPEEGWPQEAEIHNWWLSMMNARLTLDQAITRSKYGKRDLRQKVVPDTWAKLLKVGVKDEYNLPQNWLKKTGVLVGIDQMAPQGSTLIPWSCLEARSTTLLWNSIRLLISGGLTYGPLLLSPWRFSHPSIYAL